MSTTEVNIIQYDQFYNNDHDGYITYNGWTIKVCNDPWPLKYGWKFEYFIDEIIHYAKTVEEAKSEIDEHRA